MGKKSRNKGRRGELEWAGVTGGERISRIGLDGPDVESPPYQPEPVRLWEVKRVSKIPAVVRDWIAQMEREGAEAIAFRQDRDKWFTIHPVIVEEDIEDEVGAVKVKVWGAKCGCGYWTYAKSKAKAEWQLQLHREAIHKEPLPEV